jgi:proline dehydrogenase
VGSWTPRPASHFLLLTPCPRPARRARPHRARAGEPQRSSGASSREPTADDARAATAQLQPVGRMVTIDYLGEDTLDLEQARATRDAYLACCGRSPSGLHRRRRRGLAQVDRARACCSDDGHQIALEHARDDLPGRRQRGHNGHGRHGGPHDDRRDLTTVQGVAPGLPRPGRCCRPTCGAPRATAATSRMPGRGSACARVRMPSPSRSPSRSGDEVDRSYVRCLKVLMKGEGYPMVASHDPRIIEIAAAPWPPRRS